MEPLTISEVARGLAHLEDRIDRERGELLIEVRAGFDKLNKSIEAQSAERITKEVYTADQKRFELELKAVHREIASLRKLVVGSFLAVIAVAGLLTIFGG